LGRGKGNSFKHRLASEEADLLLRSDEKVKKRNKRKLKKLFLNTEIIEREDEMNP
jgi:hypothetical protein